MVVCNTTRRTLVRCCSFLLRCPDSMMEKSSAAPGDEAAAAGFVRFMEVSAERWSAAVKSFCAAPMQPSV